MCSPQSIHCSQVSQQLWVIMGFLLLPGLSESQLDKVFITQIPGRPCTFKLLRLYYTMNIYTFALGFCWFALGNCRQRNAFSFFILTCWYLNTETCISHLSRIGLHFFLRWIALVMRWGDQLYYTWLCTQNATPTQSVI